MILTPLPTSAQKSSALFAVSGIRVDISGETAVSAKDKAFLLGGRQALTAVVKRLSLRGVLPRLEAREIENLIQNYLVESEKSSATRYIGTLSYAFDAAGVRSLLQKHSILFTETRSQPLLVLSVWQSAAGAKLFRGENPWKEAWDQANLDSASLLPIITPLGDLEDAALIDGSAAKAADSAKLKKIGDKYETAKILVAVASPGTEGTVKISAKIYPVSGRGQTAVNFSVSSDTQGGALAKAVRALHRRLLGDWKSKIMAVAVTTSGDLGRVRVVFRLRNLQQWLRLQAALENIPVVKSYDVLGLSKSRAALAIRHAGRVENLRVALRQSNLLLKFNNDGDFWWLYFRGDAEPATTGTGAANSSTGTSKVPKQPATPVTKTTGKTPG